MMCCLPSVRLLCSRFDDGRGEAWYRKRRPSLNDSVAIAKWYGDRLIQPKKLAFQSCAVVCQHRQSIRS